MKTRNAVGAIVKRQNDLLLIHKVKIMGTSKSPKKIPGEWDFPKGGIKKDEEVESALRREIYEETGISDYVLIKELPPMKFMFSDELRNLIGYDNQIAKVFLVEFYGNDSELMANDEEIDQVGFFDFEVAINLLHHESAKDYLLKNIDQIGFIYKEKI